jgi:glucose/arabinose dehydrogenase
VLAASAAATLAGSLLLIPVGEPVASAATSLPPGFRLDPISTGQPPYGLSTFELLPTGGMLTLGRAGLLTFVPAAGTPRQVGQLDGVYSYGDLGALGLALAPDYAETGHVYLYYVLTTAAGPSGRVARWTVPNPASPDALVEPKVLLDVPLRDHYHGGGTVLVGDDGNLLVGIGDSAVTSRADYRALDAQRLDTPFGKLLRIRASDGTGVADNPYFDAADPTSWRSRVLAYGLRNPFRFWIDPDSHRIILGDVGWTTTEELDVITAGANYGWPCYEGTARQVGYAGYAVCQELYAKPLQPALPLWTYPHAGSHASVVGGMRYTGTAYPSAYRGAYFFGDYSRQSLWTMGLNDSAALTRAPESNGFGREVGAVVAVKALAGGDIHVADLISGNVLRLSYAPGNRPPTPAVAVSGNPDTLTVELDAAGSSDLDADQLSYVWDLGDGASASGVTVTHTYAAADTYQATLTVADGVGEPVTQSFTVVPANHRPVLQVSAPGGSTTYRVGDPVDFSGTGVDEEDGELTVTWQPAMVHCPFVDSCHRHPGEASTGPTFHDTFPDHGGNTRMEVTATVTDKAGVQAQSVFTALPRLRRLSVAAPVPVLIDGVAGGEADVVAGATASLEAPATLGPFSFVSWSDGGARQHEVTVPDDDLSLTATYRSAIDSEYARLGGTTSYLGDPLGPERDILGGRVRSYARGDLYWSAVTGTHAVRDAFRARYDALGGAATFGFPTADQGRLAGGWRMTFQRGQIFWLAATGAHEVHGSILAKYLALGGPAVIGFPTTDETAGWDKLGRYNEFQSGAVHWSSTTSAHWLHGRVRGTWKALGAGASRLGYPTTDEYVVSGGQRVRFAGGTITWLRASNRTSVAYR